MLKAILAMFFLTFAVWLVLYVQRFRYMFANKITPQKIATPESVATILPEWVNRPSDNFKNLFEMPVLFYVVSGISILIHVNDSLLTTMAWGFVILRAVHSLIHCTINLVPAQFFAYLLSTLVLFSMGVRLVFLVF